MKAVFSLVCLTLFYSSSVVAVTRYWINGGSGNFNDGTHWSLTSGGSPVGGTISWDNTDVAVFNSSSGSPMVIFTATEQIGKLQISGSITVTLMPNTPGSRTLNINAVASDALTVAVGSTLIITGTDSSTDRNMYIELDNTTGVIANIYGTVKVTEDQTGYGELRKEYSAATIKFNSGSVYDHNTKESGSDIPIATWNATSTCLISGITVYLPGNLDQAFGNLTWNCEDQTDNFNLPTLSAIQGSFKIISTGSGGLRLTEDTSVTWTLGGSYIQEGGNFYPAGGSGNNTINVGGNFSFTGGILSCPGTGSCLFRFNTSGIHTYYKTSGSTFYQKIHFEVMSGATLDMGESIITSGSSGNFTLNSGAGLKTAHSQGVYATGANGCVQLTGTRTYHSNANYTYYRNGSQSTGGGLQTSLSGMLAIGSTNNATNLTVTNSPVTVTGTLVLVSNTTTNSSIVAGTVVYSGSSSTLEYQGASAQTTTNNEFPDASGPSNVKINNSYGVNLHAGRTIIGTLSLMSGAFQIGANTLTLNGAVVKTSGTLKGGLSSNIIVGGSGASTNLPSVVLNNLTLNRQNGMGLSGNDTVYGTFTLTQGALLLNGFALVYGSAATLKYNGNAGQTTSNSEFPSVDGPHFLDNSNTSTLSLHATRTLQGDLLLNNGTFSIGSNTLYLNNGLSYLGGGLAGGINSNLVFGGTGAAGHLYYIILDQLILNRPSGLFLDDNIIVDGIFILISGELHRQGHSMYGEIAALQYQGTESQITLEEEWPATGGPHHIIIDNYQGVYLDSSRKVTGDLTLVKGDLHIGGNTLILEGIINPVMGNLSGGTESVLEIEGNGDGTQIPPVDLRKLKINRQTGAWLAGECTIYDSLQLVAGNLMVNHHTLTLQGGPVTGDPNNLITEPVSNLVFAGEHAGVSIPESIIDLNYLAVSNPNGVVLQSDILLNSSCDVTGYLICGEHSFSGNANINIFPGARFATAHPAGISGTIGVTLPSFLSSGADYEFNGHYSQETNFLETSTPGLIRNLIVNTAEGIPLVLTGNITTEGVQVNYGSILTVPDEITLTAGNPE
ncbi:MAG: hypothetical protein RBS55_00675 [Bacteroidales bacterium]|jgi:hypothetical protein|nr:hypothetical protein [Bacteroidales bacterium]